MDPRRRRTRWVLVVVGVAAAILAAGVLAWYLIDPLGGGDRGQVRASAVQATFTVAFGAGGLATLALFARRQWLQEKAHELDRQVAADNRRDAEARRQHDQLVAEQHRHDAEERRITELYMKAVEHLGHDRPSVRLGALYALDRLGRSHNGHRQAVADILCAYLRRGYEPPARFVGVTTKPTPTDWYLAGEPGDQQDSSGELAANDEYEVRMTAQRLLAGHLKDPRPVEHRDAEPPAESGQVWRLDRLDLTGATLINAEFDDCRIVNGTFENARFYGFASFDRTVFATDTVFKGAGFHADAGFIKVSAPGKTDFSYTEFFGNAAFLSCRFVSGNYSFAQFHRFAFFKESRFDNLTMFWSTRFSDHADFADARFDHGASFLGTYFGGPAKFQRTRFGDTVFTKAVFGGRADFSDVELTETDKIELSSAGLTESAVNLNHVWPPRWQ